MERKFIQLLILLAVCSIVIALPAEAVTNGGALPSSSTSTSTLIDNYIASFSWDGKLEETFNYHVTSLDNFTMLYRSFNDPLVTKYIPNPHIEFLDINAPDGTVAYIKDNTGTVSLPDGMGDTNVLSKINSLAEENEIGIYRAGGFEPGTYPVVYKFRFYPPIEYNQSAVHLNIQLAGQNKHSAYERIKIIVPEKSVREIYFSPSHLLVTRDDNSIVATGQLAENEALNFEVILEKDTLATLSGFPVSTENIVSKTEAARNMNTVVTQSVPVITQPPTQSSSGNWFNDWFINFLNPIINFLKNPNPPGETDVRPAYTISPYPQPPPVYPQITPYRPAPTINPGLVPRITMQPIPTPYRPAPTINPGLVPRITMQPIPIIPPYRPPTRY